MITIFKNKKDIPLNKEYIELNDIFFNQNTATRLDDKAAKYIQLIDASELISKYKIQYSFTSCRKLVGIQRNIFKT